MTCLAVAAAALCLVGAAEAGVHTFTAEILHRSIETHDAKTAASSYADTARLTVNGQEYSGREAIQRYYGNLEQRLVMQRILVTSPVWENGNVAHFFRQSYLVGTAGCVASVRSFERVVFDERGTVLEHRSDWHETPESVQDDLDCRHGQHAGEAGHLHFSQEKLDAVYALHHAVETASAMDFGAQLEPHVTMTIDGDTEGTLRGPQVLAWWAPVLEHVRSAIFMPINNVQSRDDRSIAVSSLFFVTDTGCSGSKEVVLYLTHSDDGPLTKIELYGVEGTIAELKEAMVANCGHGAAHDEL